MWDSLAVPLSLGWAWDSLGGPVPARAMWRLEQCWPGYSALALFLGLYLSHPVANTNIAIGVGVLFGSIFGVDAQTALVISAVSAVTSIALLAIARPLLFASLDPEVARARGIPVRALDALFLALLAVTVAEAVPAVGALLVFALLVTPAASVRRVVTRPYAALFLSAALALVITWAGLTMAFYLSYPVSFDISALGFVVYLVALAYRRVRAVKH